MADVQDPTEHITIQRDWLIAELETTEAAVASQVGQAMHYLANNRTRDARLHIEKVMTTLVSRHDALLETLFNV